MLHNDIIYGQIELTGIYEEIVNCKSFQRLADITQTEMSTIVYPELEDETRYEHSIGTYYLMSAEVLPIIEEKLKEKNIFITQEQKIMAELAALLHDFGHGVGSHLLEEITRISHEQKTIELIEDEDPEIGIYQIIEKYYGKEFVKKFIKFMKYIYGTETIPKEIQILDDGTIDLEVLLATLISHNIDVDRIDYLIRESTYTGLGTVIDYKKLIRSFECNLAGNQVIITNPKNKKYLIEFILAERARNYDEIYWHDVDFFGNHAFQQLLEELRKHPEEVPDTVPDEIRKFLTQERAHFTNREFLKLTNTPRKKAIDAIFRTTKNEKIKYLCQYRENAKNDYQNLYNARSEDYIRKLLKRVIPEFPIDSNCMFSETRTLIPYKETKFGSTKFTTEQGIQNFEDLPHIISLKPIPKTVTAINLEHLRLDLGMSKQEFEEKYADILQEIILSQTKPIQDFELKYVMPSKAVSYRKMMSALAQRYQIQDDSTYLSSDTYYDSLESFQFLERGDALRIRDGITYHKGLKKREYKNKRITYKTYEEDEGVTYTNRNRFEEIGATTNIKDYSDFLQEIDAPENLAPVLQVDNFRKLVTFLINGNAIDVSFNIANYQNNIYTEKGEIQTIEIRPRENELLGRLDLLEVKKVLEEAFPELKAFSSNANIYEIGMIDAFNKHMQAHKASKKIVTGEKVTISKPPIIARVNAIVEMVMQKRNFIKTKKKEEIEK